MKRKKKAESKEELDEEDQLMFETAKQNDKSRKCGTYRQTRAFSEN